MSVLAQTIIDQIDAVITAALAAGSLTALADRSVGDFSITKSTTIAQLMAMREKYVAAAQAEDGGDEYRMVWL